MLEVLVSAVQQDDESSERCYQTTFIMFSDERLDDEFNEVVKCYKGKVEEVMEDAEELNKQLDALIALRFRVDNPAMGSRTSDAMNLAANGKKPVRSHMDVIQEAEMSTEGNVDDEVRPDNEPKSSTNHSKVGVVGFRPPSLKVLNHVKINVTPETPLST
ncbi:hypothetical protein ACSBR1_023345 [Camellia fascicularis]